MRDTHSLTWQESLSGQGDLHRITLPVCNPDDLWSVAPNLSSLEKQVVKPFTSANFSLTLNLDKLDLLAMSTGYIYRNPWSLEQSTISSVDELQGAQAVRIYPSPNASIQNNINKSRKSILWPGFSGNITTANKTHSLAVS